MMDWAEKWARDIVHPNLPHMDDPYIDDFAAALRDTRNDALEEAAKCASMFAINQPRLHPDVSWQKTNEVSKNAAHVSAQLIAEAIRALKDKDSDEST